MKWLRTANGTRSDCSGSTGEGAATLYQELGQPVSLPPVVANNTLYILDDSGRIHAYR